MHLPSKVEENLLFSKNDIKTENEIALSQSETQCRFNEPAPHQAKTHSHSFEMKRLHIF